MQELGILGSFMGKNVTRGESREIKLPQTLEESGRVERKFGTF